ncbi:UNVERIFIED_CONTAM: hypothetical protein K2H54_062117 [Gekko kuhli]
MVNREAQLGQGRQKTPSDGGFRKEGMAAEIQGAEPLTSPPEVTGGRAQEEQQPGPVLLQNAPAGSSKGAGSADRKVPAGPPLAPSTHVVQDGAAEVAAGTSAGKSGPRKAKGTRKKGAKVTAAGTPGAKKPRGKHGPARPTGESVPTEGEGPREDGGRERPLPGPTPPLQPIPGPGYGHWGGPGTLGPWGPPPIMRQFVEAPPNPNPAIHSSPSRSRSHGSKLRSGSPRPRSPHSRLRLPRLCLQVRSPRFSPSRRRSPSQPKRCRQAISPRSFHSRRTPKHRRPPSLRYFHRHLMLQPRQHPTACSPRGFQREPPGHGSS